MWRSELPIDLGDAFPVAAARAAGVSSGRLQAQYLTAPFHGARTLRPLDELGLLELLMATLPGHAFACGPTAAAVHRMPLPAALQLSALRTPTIGVPLPHNRIRRPEVHGRSVRVSDAQLTTVDGIRCTTLARTWVDLAPVLTLPRLVAVTDHLIARRGGRLRVQALHAVHESAGSGRGAHARRDALALCSDGAESPRESELRVLLVLAGLPCPEANASVWDGDRFVARVDLLYRRHRVVVEYDGEYHQTDAQWRKDQARRAQLIDLGYRLVVVTASDFDDPTALIT
ncbi:UNVERIFIED_CONTAM: endonuclease domain-containing protein [Microbacterium sp. SLM126]